MVLEPLRALAAGTLAALVGLFAWSVLPLLAGYDATVVLSGSMAPAISPGDVVLTLPVDSEDVRPGWVVRFADPDFPDRTLLHRVSTVADDGTVVTRGDANALEDSTPMTASEITGLARIRVPYIGMLVMWRDTGEHRRLALGLVGLVSLTALATSRTRATVAQGA